MASSEDESPAVTKARERKTEQEVLQLRQQRWLEPVKFFVTCIGMILVLAGLWADREKTREQHPWDLDAELLRQRRERAAFQHDWKKVLEHEADENKGQKVQHAFEVAQHERQRQQEIADDRKRQDLRRMTEIATVVDDLCARTVSSLVDHTARSVALSVYLNALDERLADKSVPQQVRTEIGKEVADFKRELKDSGLPITTYTDGITLREKWATLKDAPTPDFSLYFGFEAAAEWKQVQSSAWRALNAFNYTADALNQKDGDIDEFRTHGARLQRRLRESIRAAASRHST